jgi:hypothetical protein
VLRVSKRDEGVVNDVVDDEGVEQERANGCAEETDGTS